jgi:hypothetical protein
MLHSLIGALYADCQNVWVSTTFGASRAYQGETLLLNPLVRPHQFLPILLVKSLAPNVVETQSFWQRAIIADST